MPSEEGKEVLRLLAEGKIDAEQAYRLLAALGDVPGEGRPRWRATEGGEDWREGMRRWTTRMSRQATRAAMRGVFGARGFEFGLGDAESHAYAGGKMLRIRVVEHGKQRVNISVPLALARLGKIRGIGERLAQKFDLDLDELLRTIEAGADGKIIDIVDEQSGDRVMVYVE